jgi:hypothetical protein
MPEDDRIPDPRDRPAPAHDRYLPDNHPASLAAFEEWCRVMSARGGLDAIAAYRQHIRSTQRRTP